MGTFLSCESDHVVEHPGGIVAALDQTISGCAVVVHLGAPGRNEAGEEIVPESF